MSRRREDNTDQPTADDLAECTPKFRLESLEPRLLLSADPISSELARMVQEDIDANNSEAVAAIIQEVDTIAESTSADHSGNQKGGVKVRWPVEWNISSDDTSSDEVENKHIDLLSVLTELVNHIHEALQTGAHPDNLIIGIKASGEHQQGFDKSEAIADRDISKTSYQEPDYQEPEQLTVNDNTSPPHELPQEPAELVVNTETDTSGSSDNIKPTINEALLDEALHDVIQNFADSPQVEVLTDLSIELTDLEDDLVAKIQGDTIFIDVNAAGNGWYIDPLMLAQLLAEADQAQAENSSDGASTNYSATSSVLPADNMHSNSDDNGNFDTEDEATPLPQSSDKDVGSLVTTAAGQADDHEANEETESESDPASILSSDILASDEASKSSATVDPDQYEYGANILDLESDEATANEASESDTDGTEQIIAIASVHRAQENNRSTRNESNRDTTKTGKHGSSDTAQVLPETNNLITPSILDDDSHAARAPPVEQASTTNNDDQDSDTAAEGAAVYASFDIENTASESTQSSTQSATVDDNDDSSVLLAEADMPRAPPVEDAIPRAPPAEDTAEYLLYDGDDITSSTETPLTPEQLNVIFQQALLIWSSSNLDAELIQRLDIITVEIAELDNGVLGMTQDYII